MYTFCEMMRNGTTSTSKLISLKHILWKAITVGKIVIKVSFLATGILNIGNGQLIM